jgi:hypothetical protein
VVVEMRVTMEFSTWDSLTRSKLANSRTLGVADSAPARAAFLGVRTKIQVGLG